MRQTNICSNRVFVSGVHACPQRSEMENNNNNKKEEKEKNDAHLKIISLKGSTLLGPIRETAGRISLNFGLQILYTMEGINTLVMGGLGLKDGLSSVGA